MLFRYFQHFYLLNFPLIIYTSLSLEPVGGDIMADCVFCKIAKGEIPSSKIWEDEKFYAFLDICPNTKGMTVVIPKGHHVADISMLNDNDVSDFIVAVKKVVVLLKKALGVAKVAVVFEGEGVNHAHFKLYPMHNLSAKHEDAVEQEHKFFDEYPGYITTVSGPKAAPEELIAIAHEIRKKFGLE
jgi:histidine triad (HIT) family protein